ncbi:hypothetical protein FXO38_25725, partial [Capsicum annuum]
MFVDFHGNEARKGGDLTPDEIAIIVGALELTKKTTKDGMTPISKAFSLDLDGTLNLWVYKLCSIIFKLSKTFYLLFMFHEKNLNLDTGFWEFLTLLIGA